jgi:hypothetical protein
MPAMADACQRRPQSVVGRSMCGTPIALPHRSESRGNPASAPYLIGSGCCIPENIHTCFESSKLCERAPNCRGRLFQPTAVVQSKNLFYIMDPRQDVKQPRGVAKRRRWRRRRTAMPANAHTPSERDKAMKCWIPADIVQNTAEYLGRVANLLSFRGVSTGWQGAVSDAVGFLNGRCWTQLAVKFRGQYCCPEVGPLWIVFHLDDAAVVARCAMLCLAPRLETLEWRYGADQINYERLAALRLSIHEWSYAVSQMCYRRLDVSCLRNCPVLKKLDLFYNNSVIAAGIRGLELIPTLEDLDLSSCKQITDVSFLRNCRALKKFTLANTNVTDAGILGLEFIPTLEELSLYGCEQITDVSCLRNCRALKTLNLCCTNVTDAGILGLELIPTLEMLSLASCKQVHFPAISADQLSSTVDSCPTVNRFLLR